MSKLKFDSTLVCHKCDYLDQTKPAAGTITFPADVWATWQAATRVRPELEILGLFSVGEDGRVTDLVIPRQEIEGGSCTLLEQNGHHDGMIHSHHNMGAFFSTMDKETALPNYRFNVVTDHKGGYEAAERITLPCGGYGFVDLNIAVEYAPEAAALRDHVLAVCQPPNKQEKKVEPINDRAKGGELFTPTVPFESKPYQSYQDWEREAWEDSFYESGNGHGDSQDDVVAGCHTCEVYWDNSYGNDSPERCWFCARQLAPVTVDLTLANHWTEAAEAVEGMRFE